MAGYGASPGERRGGRVAGVKNKKTLERESLISRAIGELNRPLGMTLRGMAHDLAAAARAGDKEAQQKRVYYQGTLETDKANYRALARWAGDGVWSTKEGCHNGYPWHGRCRMHGGSSPGAPMGNKNAQAWPLHG